jgi:HPt (histidine-containing phosphotransfer) domain-containing protein
MLTLSAEALRTRFLSGFQRRVDELHILLASDDLRAAERAFHSLAGIGGTYGFPLVTTLARRAEHHCATAKRREVEQVVATLTAMAKELAA